MPKYLLIVGGADLDKRSGNPDFRPQMLERYTDWIRGLSEGGKLIDSHKLLDQTGRRLTIRGGEVIDGPFIEAKDAVGGIFIVEASDLDEATELAHSCPGLDLQRGYVEVRPRRPSPLTRDEDAGGDGIRAALEQHFQRSHSRVIAALTRRFGARHLALAEQAIQDAYVRALSRWPVNGLPDDPEGWLVRVAHNAVIDALRRQRANLALEQAKAVPDDAPPAFDTDDEIQLMFLCCDPALTRAAQIALVLNVAFGLTSKQIAVAFVTDERTVAQRIVRAKQRLRDAGVRFDMPSSAMLPVRIAAILDVLYLVFSEGYSPSVGEEAFDEGLCREALRFVRLFADRPDTALPTVFAVRALLCFHASRAAARFADDGSLLLLSEQDRARWDDALVREAFVCLDRAGVGLHLTRYHIEAAIAGCHAVAPTYAGTDWARIVELYDLLRARAPSLVVDVNRALAVAMAAGARAGLDELDAIPERDVLARYPYALAAYAELHASLGELETARSYLDRAAAHQPSGAQAALLRRKRAALDPSEWSA